MSTKTEHSSWLEVKSGDYIYEIVVGTNIQNALYWNPENLQCFKTEVTSIEDTNGFPFNTKRVILNTKLVPTSAELVNFVVLDQYYNSNQEVRIFDHIYFGNVTQSRIKFLDCSEHSRFVICDEKLFKEILENLQKDYMLAQKNKMKMMKQNMKILNRKINKLTL